MSLNCSSSVSRNSSPATELCIFIFREVTPKLLGSDSLSPYPQSFQAREREREREYCFQIETKAWKIKDWRVPRDRQTHTFIADEWTVMGILDSSGNFCKQLGRLGGTLLCLCLPFTYLLFQSIVSQLQLPALCRAQRADVLTVQIKKQPFWIRVAVATMTASKRATANQNCSGSTPWF